MDTNQGLIATADLKNEQFRALVTRQAELEARRHELEAELHKHYAECDRHEADMLKAGVVVACW